MATVLVTGCAGFIGSHVCDLLLAEGDDVVGLDDLSGGFQSNVPRGVQFVKGRVQDPEIVAAIFSAYRPKYVIHAAAYAAEGLSHFIRRYNYENNLLGSMVLLNEAINRKIDCFIFLSSLAVYGRGPLPFVEWQDPEPIDPYGIAKYAVEMDLKAANEMFGLQYVIFRPHNVYGPRQNCGDPYRNVVGIFMRQCLHGKPMTIYGDGNQIRSFSFIEDIAGPIAAVVGRPRAWNTTYNIGGEEIITINELAERVAAAMGVPLNTVHLPGRNEARVTHCKHDKAREVFDDVMPTKPFHVGLPIMAKWVQERGVTMGERFKTIEVERMLPEFWTQLMATQ